MLCERENFEMGGRRRPGAARPRTCRRCRKKTPWRRFDGKFNLQYLSEDPRLLFFFLHQPAAPPFVLDILPPTTQRPRRLAHIHKNNESWLRVRQPPRVISGRVAQLELRANCSTEALIFFPDRTKLPQRNRKQVKVGSCCSRRGRRHRSKLLLVFTLQ